MNADEDPFEEDDKLSHTLGSKYEAVSVETVAEEQKHLTPQQRGGLSNLLRKFSKIFSGGLGKFIGRKMHLELIPNATPVHKRAYPVPHAHLKLFKDELDKLVQLGVLSKCGASEWAAPSFIIPKKDGRVRWITDFRELNRVIKRKVYPLPKIHEILRKRAGYQFFTKLDISMMYYTFELTEEAKDLCVIVTPFGKYRYERVPMGVKQSPDFAQEVMEDVLRDILDIEVYINDIGWFSNSWEEHLQLLDNVLTKL